MPLVANSMVEINNSSFGLQPSFFFGALFSIKRLPFFYKSYLKFNFEQKKIAKLSALLIAFSAITLIFPLAHLLVGTNAQFNLAFLGEDYYYKYPTHAISQFCYFIFFWIYSISVVTKLKFEDVNKLANLYCYAVLFSVIIGLLFGHLSNYGYPYPGELLNNHRGYSQGFEQTALIGGIELPRLSSTMPEPSMFSFLILPALTYKVFSFKLRSFTSILFELIIIIIYIIGILLSTSTIGYIGILVIFLLNFSNSKFKIYYLIFILILTYIVFLKFGDIIAYQTIEKLSDSSSSAGERFHYFLEGINIFKTTFFLGSGFGINNTADLTSTLISNIGLFGFILFIYINFLLIKNGFRFDSSLAFAYLLIILTSLLGIPGLIFLFPWFFSSLIFTSFGKFNGN